MNIGTVSRVALKAVASEGIESKLLVSKKIIKDLEDNPNEASFRLCRDLRAVLKSVTKDPQATAGQITESGALLSRVKKLDPRTSDHSERSEPIYQELTKPKSPAPKVPDGFDPAFLNVNESISRVTAKYNVPPRYADLENQRLLETFLGDGVLLDVNSARQIWLHLAQEFKSRGGSPEKTFTSIFPPVIVAVQTALCQFVNSRHIAVPAANCLSHTDDLFGFRW